MLQYSSKDKDVFEELARLANIPKSKVISIFETFTLLALIKYSENQSITVPLMGDIEIEYKDDIVSLQGKEAVLDCKFHINDFFKRVAGQFEDAKETKNFTAIDIVKILQKDTDSIISEKLD